MLSSDAMSTTKQKNAISPQVEAILSQCADDADRIRIAKRLEAIAAELWERVFGEKKPGTTVQFQPFRRN
jgi:hypothetical protein